MKLKETNKQNTNMDKEKGIDWMLKRERVGGVNSRTGMGFGVEPDAGMVQECIGVLLIGQVVWKETHTKTYFISIPT